MAGGTGEDPGEGGVTEGTRRKGLLPGRGSRRHDEWPPDALMPFHVFRKVADSLGLGLSFAFIQHSQHSPRGRGSGRNRITMETWKYPFPVFLKQV